METNGSLILVWMWVIQKKEVESTGEWLPIFSLERSCGKYKIKNILWFPLVFIIVKAQFLLAHDLSFQSLQSLHHWMLGLRMKWPPTPEDYFTVEDNGHIFSPFLKHFLSQTVMALSTHVTTCSGVDGKWREGSGLEREWRDRFTLTRGVVLRKTPEHWDS